MYETCYACIFGVLALGESVLDIVMRHTFFLPLSIVPLPIPVLTPCCNNFCSDFEPAHGVGGQCIATYQTGALTALPEGAVAGPS
jgi:hypothetical protein